MSSHSRESQKSPEPMDPTTFSLLKQLTDTVANLTARMGALETRQPLASAFEQGDHSQPQPRGPLPDQRTAFEAATLAQQGNAPQGPWPPPPQGQPGHRYGYDPRPNSPLPRNVVPPMNVNKYNEEEEQSMMEEA